MHRRYSTLAPLLLPILFAAPAAVAQNAEAEAPTVGVSAEEESAWREASEQFIRRYYPEWASSPEPEDHVAFSVEIGQLEVFADEYDVAAARLLSRDIIEVLPAHERERLLRERYLDPLDYAVLNRWILPWGQSAEERAEAAEEAARQERLREDTRRVIHFAEGFDRELAGEMKAVLYDSAPRSRFDEERW